MYYLYTAMTREELSDKIAKKDFKNKQIDLEVTQNLAYMEQNNGKARFAKIFDENGTEYPISAK